MIATFTVEPGSPLDGTTLGWFDLRKRYNILVLAIRRGEEMITGLGGETGIEAGDVAIVYASPEDIAKGIPSSSTRTAPDRLLLFRCCPRPAFFQS